LPTRITGLKGYVAEAVIEHWLRRRRQPTKCEIVRQIIPTDVDKKGGAFLDFGVIADGLVTEVYEVKGQDYIFGKDSEVNKSLLYLWKTHGQQLEFVTQDRRLLQGTPGTKGFLVLLVPPNKDWVEKIGAANVRFVKLFREIWGDMSSKEDESELVQSILRDVAADITEVLSIFRNPTQGATLLKWFLELQQHHATEANAIAEGLVSNLLAPLPRPIALPSAERSASLC
jgi:hypothetical protein